MSIDIALEEEFLEDIKSQNRDVEYAIDKTTVAERDVVDQQKEMAFVNDGVEQGGLDKDAIEMIENSIEKFAEKYGLDYSKWKPAKEEAAYKNISKLALTKAALETEKNILLQIWDKIKAAFAWVWDKITRFFELVFQRVDAYENTLKELRKTISSNPKIEFKDVENRSLAERLSRGGEGNTQSAIDTVYNAYILLDNAVTIPEFVEDVIKNIEAMKGKKRDEMVSSHKDIVLKVWAKWYRSSSGGYGYYTYVGDWRYDIAGDDETGRFSVVKQYPESIATILKAIDKNKVDELIDDCLQLCECVREFKRNKTRIDGVLGTIKRFMDKCKRAVMGVDKADDATFVTNAMSSLKEISCKFYSSVVPNSIDAIISSIKYIKQSMVVDNG